MEVKQLCTAHTANIVKVDGGLLFSIELPTQPMGYDTKKDEGIPYMVDFIFIPDPHSEQPRRINGNWSVTKFREIPAAITKMYGASAKFLYDDPALSARDAVEGSDVIAWAFYRETQLYIKLKILGVTLDEAPLIPGMFAPLIALAEGYETEREAFEQKMRAKVERVGKDDE